MKVQWEEKDISQTGHLVGKDYTPTSGDLYITGFYGQGSDQVLTLTALSDGMVISMGKNRTEAAAYLTTHGYIPRHNTPQVLEIIRKGR